MSPDKAFLSHHESRIVKGLVSLDSHSTGSAGSVPTFSDSKVVSQLAFQVNVDEQFDVYVMSLGLWT